MARFPSDVAFTPAVKEIQTRKGSRAAYAKMERGSGWETTVTPELRAFVAQLDMFYLATANAQGQPYIQYRGGPPGFLKALDEKTLAFADFGGNRQHITAGNLSENPRAFIFLMNYVEARRIKLWGRARIVEGDAGLEQRLRDPAYPGTVERAVVFEIEAWDVNCPQHIHKRYPASQVASALETLQREVRDLRAQVARYEREARVAKPERA